MLAGLRIEFPLMQIQCYKLEIRDSELERVLSCTGVHWANWSKYQQLSDFREHPPIKEGRLRRNTHVKYMLNIKELPYFLPSILKDRSRRKECLWKIARFFEWKSKHPLKTDSRLHRGIKFSYNMIALANQKLVHRTENSQEIHPISCSSGYIRRRWICPRFQSLSWACRVWDVKYTIVRFVNVITRFHRPSDKSRLTVDGFLDLWSLIVVSPGFSERH